MVVLGASKDPNAKVTVVLVSERTGRAELVAKAATRRPAAVAVEREWQLLRSVRDLLPERLRRTLPVPVEMCELGGRPALVTSALEGTPLAVRYLDRGHTAARSTVATDFALAAAWLADVQEASVSGAHEPLRLAGDLVAPLQRRYPDERDDGPVVSGLLELDRRLSRAATARTVVHGDFWAGNLLVDAGRLSGVVDWEAAAVQGEPVRDLARFALSYALYLDRRTRPGRVVRGHPQLRAGCWGRPVEFALEGNGWFPEVFRDFLRAGLRRLDVSPAHWRDVALVGVAELAARSDDDVFARRHLDLFRRTVTA
jgi:aminoglycoside phosphotransferase (APT) family kinase protein